MGYQPFYIAGLKSGLVKNPKSFLIPQDAFPELRNAYIWRDIIKRKRGYELLGRLQRILTAVSMGNSPGDPWNGNVFTLLGLAATEPNASIRPGTVTIVSGANTYTDPASDGVLVGVPGGSGTINYATGSFTLTGMGGGAATTISMTYRPGLPVMGLKNYELSSINLEDSIAFDTKYAYRFNRVSGEFQEWIAGTTWSGTNSDFFWATNYWQDSSNRDLLWATNFNTAGSGDPIRYSNSVSWTDFAPALGVTCIDQEVAGTITNPWVAFAGNLANTDIALKSVTITIANEGATDPVNVLKDDGAGNLVQSDQSRSDSGTINYTTGAITLTINPALTEDTNVNAEYCFGSSFLQQALILIPYKDRLLAFHTFEGATFGTSVTFPQRLRYSQNGDPTDTFDGWRSDVPGRGGFIDAPTNEQIVGVDFIRDILVVYMERSTWQIRYTGNEVLPFVWEKINTELGSDATFSLVPFDRGILAVGRDSIHVCDGNAVERIDLQIPDEAGSFVSANDANKRVQGIRDLNIQLIYWTYVSNADKTFPDKLLVYNYVDGNFSIWDDHFTVLGRWYTDSVTRWQDITDVWQEWDHPWNWAFRQQNFPDIIGGNQHGFVEIFNQSTVNDVSLYITDIAAVNGTELTIPNHDLSTGDFIRVRNIIGDAANEAINGEIYLVTLAFTADTVNKLNILQYNGDPNAPAFSNVTPGSVYTGNGVIEVCNNFVIRSKRFNIFEAGVKSMLGYIDFLNQTTNDGEFTCQIYIDENLGEAINTGSYDIGTDSTAFFNSIVDTSRPQFSPANSSSYWHRFYCQTDGTTFQYLLTFSDLQMVDPGIYQSEVTINALILWMKDGGRLVS